MGHCHIRPHLRWTTPIFYAEFHRVWVEGASGWCKNAQRLLRSICNTVRLKECLGDLQPFWRSVLRLGGFDWAFVPWLLPLSLPPCYCHHQFIGPITIDAGEWPLLHTCSQISTDLFWYRFLDVLDKATQRYLTPLVRRFALEPFDKRPGKV